MRLALACLLARGHLLIEDLPGVGKTTLAHVLAKTPLGLQFQRIQFTSDMLPADILGVDLRARHRQFQVPSRADLRAGDPRRRGQPLDAEDAVGAARGRWRSTRSPPRARRGSCPRRSSSSPRRTPRSRSAPSCCPSRPLDRFMMRIELGYPDRAAERALSGTDRRDMLATLDPCMSPAELVELQSNVQKIHVAPALLDYVQAIVEHTRRSPEYVAGLSPRAALALVHSARAWALLEGRDKVIPDVQAIMPGVAAHRLRPAHDSARRDVGAQLLPQSRFPGEISPSGLRGVEHHGAREPSGRLDQGARRYGGAGSGNDVRRARGALPGRPARRDRVRGAGARAGQGRRARLDARDPGARAALRGVRGGPSGLRLLRQGHHCHRTTWRALDTC